MRITTAITPGLAIGLLALTGCSNDDTTATEPSTISRSATPSASATASPSVSKTKTPTPEATPIQAPEAAPQAPAPAQPVAPAAPSTPLTPGEWCTTNTPVLSSEIQTCGGIEMGYIDPITGGYIGDGELPYDQPVPDYSIADPDAFDPDDPDTWSGTDPDTGGQWAGVPGPTVDF